jgi:tetratricopeptide (TPR) repeat protein
VQGRAFEAEPVLRECLSMASFLQSTEPWKLAMVYGDLATLHREAGRFANAEAEFKSALELTPVTTVPVEHATQLNNYGLLLLQMHRDKEARTAFESALRTFNERLGAEHASSVGTTSNLALANEKTHHFEQAAELYQRVIDLDTAHYGKANARVGIDMNSYATFEFNRRHYAEADRLLREAETILREAPGANAADLARVDSNLGRVLWEEKRYGEAEQEYAESIRLGESAWGGDSPKLLAAFESYAVISKQNQHFAESEQAEVRAMRIRVRQALAKPAGNL